MTFTFKKHPHPTGLAGVGASTWVDIKIKKRKCGIIYGGGWQSKDSLFRIQLAVKYEDDAAVFGNNLLKIKFETVEEAKMWLKANYEKIIEKYNLHFYED